MNWHYLTQEQKNIGPVSDHEFADLIKSGAVTRSTLVWNETLEGWIKAAESPAAIHFGGALPPPPPLEAGRSINSDSSFTSISEHAGHHPRQATAPPSGRIPVWWLWTLIFLAGALLVELGLILHHSAEKPGWISDTIRSSSVVAHARQDGVSDTFAIHLLGNLCVLAAIPLLLAFIVFHCLVLYRSWSVVPRTERRLHPAAVVALLFVPIFNYYWVFRAYWGLARRLNRSPAPIAVGVLKESVSLFFCISALVSVVAPPLNLFAFPVATLAAYAVTLQLARVAYSTGVEA